MPKVKVYDPDARRAEQMAAAEVPAGGAAEDQAGAEVPSESQPKGIAAVVDNPEVRTYDGDIQRLAIALNNCHVMLGTYAAELLQADGEEYQRKFSDYMRWRMEIELIPRQIGHLKTARELSRHIALWDEIKPIEEEISELIQRRDATKCQPLDSKSESDIERRLEIQRVEFYNQEISAARKKVAQLRARLDAAHVTEDTVADDEGTWHRAHLERARWFAQQSAKPLAARLTLFDNAPPPVVVS